MLQNFNQKIVRFFTLTVLIFGTVFLSDTVIQADGDLYEEMNFQPEQFPKLFPHPEDACIRITRNADGTMRSMDTSLLTFVSPDGTTRVTLAGAIHLGEKSYYQALNRRFRDFDAVLYEMVGDDSPRPEKAEFSLDPIMLLQYSSGWLLDLEHQVGSIDYRAPNFIHADMSTAEFLSAQLEYQDGALVWFLRSYGYQLGMNSVGSEFYSDLDLLKLVFLPNIRRTLLCSSAESMADVRSSIAPLEGKNGSSILTARNEKAFRILREELDSGKKNVALFYGAAHLPDFMKRLEKELGMKPEKIEWFPCWIFAPEAPKPAAQEKNP